MIVKRISIIFLVFSCGMAKADIISETSCYVNVPKENSKKHIQLALRTYEDKDLKREVGAFVQYNGSREIIPITFSKRTDTDTDSPNLGNYEISRVEVLGKKVTGEYVVVQTGAGNTQGKFIKYTNFESKKTTTFMHTGEDDPNCKVNK